MQEWDCVLMPDQIPGQHEFQRGLKITVRLQSGGRLPDPVRWHHKIKIAEHPVFCARILAAHSHLGLMELRQCLILYHQMGAID